MDTGSDSALQDLLKLRENEVDFLSALRDLIESNWRLTLQVEDLQKRLKEKEGELSKANETIGALTADVNALQTPLQLQKSSGKEDVPEQTSHPTSDIDIQAKTCSDPPATCIPSPACIKTLEAESGTRQTPPQDVTVDETGQSELTSGHARQGNKDNLASDGDDAENAAGNDHNPRGEDVHSCPDDGSTSSPSKKTKQERRTRAKTLCHTCSVCNMSFGRLSALRLHQRTHNKKTTSPQKSQPTTLEEALNPSEGVKKRLLSLAKPHKCRECGKSFRRAGNLKDHHNIHTGEKPYPCSLCEKAFSQKSSIMTHLITHACKTNPMPCPQCQVTFVSSVTLRRHLKEHRKQKAYVCSKCDAPFPSGAQLRSHKAAAHEVERPFACAYCKKTFRNTSGLKEHERTHTGEKPYLCDNCGRSFSCSQHLKTHRRTHTGERPFRCEECGESFAQGITLRKHRLRHTGERPHLCALCGKAFARPEVLKTHQRVHSGEKPYGCPQCGQKFTYAQSLQAHQTRAHPGPAPEGPVEILAAVVHP
ncbi:gastrula zinc finger protein XlCGF26.1-like [Engraulis encrasicolus]|uniref:gastrula zinc finger protein XlCGF26.1-like n=1 Tax=Engraulis encrasicolus TaxID=184585 RepID=UPI002FCE91CB